MIHCYNQIMKLKLTKKKNQLQQKKIYVYLVNKNHYLKNVIIIVVYHLLFQESVNAFKVVSIHWLMGIIDWIVMYFEFKTFLRACLQPSLNTQAITFTYSLLMRYTWLYSFLDLPISSLAQLVPLMHNMVSCSCSSCKSFLHWMP